MQEGTLGIQLPDKLWMVRCSVATVAAAGASALAFAATTIAQPSSAVA